MPYTIAINNTGNDLVDNLSLVENLQTAFGGAFVGLTAAPTISLTNTSGNAVVNANTATFNGNSVDEILDTATSQLGIGDSATITLSVELDPDAPTANLVGGALLNSATASGTDSAGGTVSDVSDDPTNPTSDADDPTSFSLAGLSITKSVGTITPATTTRQLQRYVQLHVREYRQRRAV